MQFDIVRECVAGHKLVPLEYQNCDCYKMHTNRLKDEDGCTKYLYCCKVCGIVFVRDHEPETK